MSDQRDYSSIRNDFEARLQFLSAEEGGRQTPFVLQGYRPDFSYADELDAAFMIWPIFVDEHGEPLAKDTKVSTDKLVNARMIILDDVLRVTEHRKRITEGLNFLCEKGERLWRRAL